jgi:predicted nuclease with TOPRIM domain
LKRQKEIAEWITRAEPNGIEILARISQAPTDYAPLIKRALIDIRVVERRADALLARETVEFTARKAETEAALGEVGARLAAVRGENERLREEIRRSDRVEKSLRSDLRRSFDASQAPALTPSSPKAPLTGRDLIDPITFFIAERERLEAMLDTLENRLRALNHEQIAFHGAISPRASRLSE